MTDGKASKTYFSQPHSERSHQSRICGRTMKKVRFFEFFIKLGRFHGKNLSYLVFKHEYLPIHVDKIWFGCLEKKNHTSVRPFCVSFSGKFQKICNFSKIFRIFFLAALDVMLNIQGCFIHKFHSLTSFSWLHLLVLDLLQFSFQLLNFYLCNLISGLMPGNHVYVNLIVPIFSLQELL